MAINKKPIEYNRISKPYKDIGEHYKVVVIGSGYGGSIAALRMAQANPAAKPGESNVCLLERGREIIPGEYPTTLAGMQQETQIRTDKHSSKLMGKASAMFDLRVNEDVSAMVGCGLGGTSLINANVSIEMDKNLFNREGLEWPKEFRHNPGLLDGYIETAKTMLGANHYPYPDDKDKPGFKKLNKYSALEKSAKALGVEVSRLDINVTFKDETNSAGVFQPKCNLCGDCCSGCNFGSKNTTLMNYLPMAHNFGADLFCNATVNYLEKLENSGKNNKKGLWKIHIKETDSNDISLEKIITADIVILAAGTLGSTEIMLRSKAKGLVCSDQLGKHFSGNGDTLAFSYNSYWKDNDEDMDPALRDEDSERYESIYGIGMGDNDLTEKQMPGPCTTGVIDLRDENKPWDQQLIIEEGVTPGAASSIVPASYFFAATEQANFLRYGQEQAQSRLEDIQNLVDSVQNPGNANGNLSYTGAISRCQTFLMMSVDDSQGQLLMDHNQQLKIHWPDAGKSSVFQYNNNTAAKASDAIQGQFISNPLWNQAFGNKIITVHPLGGCGMADDAERGVVNHAGQVFSERKGGELHSGLYICDGAVIPGAVGVNPLLTISALAERTCELIIEENNWTINKSKTVKRKIIPTSKDDDKFIANKASTTDCAKPVLEGMPEFIERSLSVVSLGSIGGLVAQIASIRKGAYSSEKEKSLTAAAIHTATAVLDNYADDYTCSVEFTETMAGYCSISQQQKHLTDKFELAYQRGKAQGNSLALTLTIAAENIHKLTQDRNYLCAITAVKIECKTISESLSFQQGTFQLLSTHSNSVESWIMKYHIRCQTADNKSFFIVGTKTLHCTQGSHWWTDLTELSVAIYQGEDEKGSLIAMGIAKLDLQDFMQQAGTIKTELTSKSINKILNMLLENPLITEELIHQLKKSIGVYYLAKLAASLAEIVFRSYGGLLSSLKNFPKQEYENKQKQKISVLKAPLPECFEVNTDDGFKILLTRYNGGGNNPPVILAPGMGVNASSFTTDSVDVNLVEFLTFCGPKENPKPARDVWLLDYRASADSGSSNRAFNIDEIAKYDWPTAIKTVIEKVNKERKIDNTQVQIIAHCVGSMSLLMGLMAGHIKKDQIQSMLCSQLTLHPVTNWLNNAKADMDIIHELEQLPIIQKNHNSINMNSGTSIFDRTLDVMAYQMPIPADEACNNPVCRRVFTAYGPSYLHNQLNHATHIKMSEWFKSISLEPFKQMSKIIQAGYVVDADGKNSYFSNDCCDKNNSDLQLPNLDLPINFIAGALNLMFVPETSQRTYDWICAHNSSSKEKYQRHVFEGYGHMDCFIGKNAYRDIFPYLLEQLDAKH